MYFAQDCLRHCLWRAVESTMAWRFEYEGDRGWTPFTKDRDRQINHAISEMDGASASGYARQPRVTLKHAYWDPRGRQQDTDYTIDSQKMIHWQTRDSVKLSCKGRNV